MDGKVRTGKHLYDTFPVQNGLKQGDVLPPSLVNFILGYAIRMYKYKRRNKRDNELLSLLIISI